MLRWFRLLMWLRDRDPDDIVWMQAAVDARLVRRRLAYHGYDVTKVFDELLQPKHINRDTKVSYPAAFYRITDEDVSRAYDKAINKAIRESLGHAPATLL